METQDVSSTGAAAPTDDIAPGPPRIIHATKTHDLRTALVDSTAWNDFAFRPDDVLVVTYGKAGTSWMQAILAQLLLGIGSNAAAHPQDASSWLEMRSSEPVADRHARLAAQTHRRFLKSHLPLGILPYSPHLKYIYIARDARDLIWSMHNHHSRTMPEAFDAVNALPDRCGPPMAPPPADPVVYWREWMDGDGAPWWPFWSHTRSWWAARDRPNVLLLHYADMLADLPAVVRQIVAFLDLSPLTPDEMATVVDRCSFAYMREHASNMTPGGGRFFHGGPQSFIFKGTNGRWRGVLPDADVAAYEARVVTELGEDCARWLAEGGRV